MLMCLFLISHTTRIKGFAYVAGCVYKNARMCIQDFEHKHGKTKMTSSINEALKTSMDKQKN